MRIRQTCAYMLMAGGILLFAGGATQADQSKSGSGGSGGAMKQGHESKQGHDSSKAQKDSSVITKDNPGGIVTRGGRGDITSPSNVDPLSTDQRKDSGHGSTPGSGSGNMGSGGNMGSSGGTGSSGGGTGSSSGGSGY